MENLLNRIPEPLLNQIKDLSKGIEKYKQGQVVVLYDPNKDDIAGLYVPHSGLFTPNYKYFILLEYVGLNDYEEQEYIFNNVIIPNIGLPEGTALNPNTQKDKRVISFIEDVFRKGLEKGSTIKMY
jgi:hypothetical protein